MPWVYQQSTGRLTRDGVLIATGHAGHAEGRNNPSLQHVRDTGPLPQGLWRILPPQNPVRRLGPLAMPLEPIGKARFELVLSMAIAFGLRTGLSGK